MAIKTSVQGLLIYQAMMGYLVALWFVWRKQYKAADWVYAIGFVSALAAVGYRWASTHHAPFMNLFEIFLCLGALYPLVVFIARLLRIGGRSFDLLISLGLLVPAGFVFDAEPQRLPPALRHFLFVPHVSVYLLAYSFLVKAGIQAMFELFRHTSSDNERRAASGQEIYRLVCMGFPLLALGLVIGSYWGKLAWGDYWGWDPKELWSLSTLLVYTGYFHFRAGYGNTYVRINNILIVLGLALILVTLLWANLSDLFHGLHDYAAPRVAQ